MDIDMQTLWALYPIIVYRDHESLINGKISLTKAIAGSIYNNDVHRIESIQRRAARWVLKDYSRHSSVTSMLQLARISSSTKNI